MDEVAETIDTSVDDKTIARFWARVEQRGDADCWIWQGAKNDSGFGIFVLRHTKTIYTHKLAYMLTRGDVQDKQRLVHTCHNRACCNPAHIVAVSPTEARSYYTDAREKRLRATDAVDEADVVDTTQPVDDTPPLDADLFPDELFGRTVFTPSDDYVRSQFALLDDSAQHPLATLPVSDFQNAWFLANVYGRLLRFSPATAQWSVYHHGAWQPVHERVVCRLVQLVLRLRLLAIARAEGRTDKRMVQALMQCYGSLEHLLLTVRLAEMFMSDGSEAGTLTDEFA